MAQIVRGGLIQATLSEPGTAPIEKIKKSMIDKHVGMIEQAASLRPLGGRALMALFHERRAFR